MDGDKDSVNLFPATWYQQTRDEDSGELITKRLDDSDEWMDEIWYVLFILFFYVSNIPGINDQQLLCLLLSFCVFLAVAVQMNWFQMFDMHSISFVFFFYAYIIGIMDFYNFEKIDTMN